jgi:nucleoside-diphosphate-sugar epimerase
MKIFVTGGSGFVGGHFIERVAKDHAVFALARSESSEKLGTKYGATPVRGELGAISRPMLEGIDVVVHAGAFVAEWGTRADFERGNVEATRQLLRVAREAGVKRFVHVGTEAAIFDGAPLVMADETHPYPARQRFLYSETKAEAERLVLGANDHGFATVSIRPRLVWGPRDGAVLPAILRAKEKGDFAWLDGGRHRTSTVHVFNVARALELALGRGEGGRAFFVVDEGVTTYREFLSALAKTQGVDLGTRSLPGGIARAAAGAIEGAWRMFGVKRAPPMTTFAVCMLSTEVTIDGSRAARELGYVPVITRAEGLKTMPKLA